MTTDKNSLLSVVIPAHNEEPSIANALDFIKTTLLSCGMDWEIIMPREIGVLDRIGGGDGFVGGLLYGILKGWDVQRCARFGWATGALAATMLTDYGQPADEEQVWSIWEGNARVKR